MTTFKLYPQLWAIDPTLVLTTAKQDSLPHCPSPATSSLPFHFIKWYYHLLRLKSLTWEPISFFLEYLHPIHLQNFQISLPKYISIMSFQSPLPPLNPHHSLLSKPPQLLLCKSPSWSPPSTLYIASEWWDKNVSRISVKTFNTSPYSQDRVQIP